MSYMRFLSRKIIGSKLVNDLNCVTNFTARLAVFAQAKSKWCQSPSYRLFADYEKGLE